MIFRRAVARRLAGLVICVGLALCFWALLIGICVIL